MKKINVGFIGLGNMGGPMARNIMKSDYPLCVLDIKKELTDSFERDGADVAASPQELGEKCDIVLTSLPTQAASEDVWLGKNGVLAGAKPNCIFVELSTVHPDFVKRLNTEASRKDVMVIDAGLSGGIKKAEDGTLTIMAGGKKEAIDLAYPVFEVIGKTIYHVGDIGAGMVVKLVNNAMGHINVAAFIECISV